MASVRQIFSLFLKYDYSAILWHWNAPRWRQRHGGRRGGLSEAQLWQNFQVSGDSQTTLQRVSHSGRWPVLPLSHLWDGLQAQEETGRASEPCPRDQGLSGQCPHAQLISVEPVLSQIWFQCDCLSQMLTMLTTFCSSRNWCADSWVEWQSHLSGLRPQV